MTTGPFTGLALSFYSGLWTAATPLLRRHKRLREGFAERLAPLPWPGADTAPDGVAYNAAGAVRLWMQAASGGEARLVHSLLPALAERFAALPASAGRPLHALCTTCTRQGLEVLENLPPLPGVRLYPRYFPLDKPAIMRRAVRSAQPQLVALLETELWPGLLAAAAEAGVPVVILNGRMREASRKAYRLLRAFWRQCAPARVLAISPEDGRRFADLFGEGAAVSIMPNIKFDGVASPLPARAGQELRQAAGIADESLLALLASTREEEEDGLLTVIQELCRKAADKALPLTLVIAPRHMHRAAAWREKLASAGLSAEPRSALSDPPSPVIIWDSFGQLPALYAAADAVFVGGSLAPLGGQNFLEAAAQGLVPLVGPHTENFHWVGEEFFRLGLGKRVSESGLAPAIEDQLAARREALARRAAAGQSLRAARESEAAVRRQAFADWLRPRLGGSAIAAEATRDIWRRNA